MKVRFPPAMRTGMSLMRRYRKHTLSCLLFKWFKNEEAAPAPNGAFNDTVDGVKTPSALGDRRYSVEVIAEGCRGRGTVPGCSSTCPVTSRRWGIQEAEGFDKGMFSP